jgi:hypothetical protein
MTRSRLLSIVAVVVGVAFIIGVWYGLFRPTRVAEKAVENLAATNTAAFKAILELSNNESTEALLGEAGTIELTANGHFDRAVTPRSALAANVNVAIKTDSVTVQSDGEARFIGDKVYVQITKAPAVFPVLAQLKNAWIYFERGGQDNPAAATPQAPLFTSVKRESVETIDGVSTVKYSAKAADTAVIRMMDGLADMFGTSLTADQIANIKKSVAEVEEVPVELWVKRWSSDLRQFRTVLVVPGGNTVNFTVTLTDKNQPVDITVPEGAVTANEALQATAPQ